MTLKQIIEQVRADGIRLAVSQEGKIKARGNQVAVDRWLPILQRHKPEIMSMLHVVAKELGPVEVPGIRGGETISGVDDIAIEPASLTARPIYWESMDGTWHGPVKPEYLGRTGKGHREQYWVIVTYQKSIQWIRADLLRSRQEAERARQGTKK